MQKYVRIIFSLIVVFLCTKATTGQVFADQDFDVSLQSTYTVSSTGTTDVEQKFHLVNKTPTYYAKDYALEFGSGKLSRVRVFDDRGDIPANIVTSENKTSIGISFADKIVGEGKSRTFTVSFTNPDTTQISGSVLEVDVPKLLKANEYSSYQVTIKTPLSFGTPARVNPAASLVTSDGRFTKLQFDNLGEQSVSALFGEKQVFDFTVINNVANPTSNLGVVQLALPPDTQRQKVHYIELEPLPKEMTRDEDGNWIATYEVPAEKNLNVSLTGKVVLTLNDEQKLSLPDPNSQWTLPQKYWEANASQVQELAKKYTTPKSIYDFVSTHLNYNYSRESSANNARLGAAGSLAAPTNAVCQEFTDLFVGLARANNIPSRRAVGYAYTVNGRLRPLGFVRDSLHAWPEYFDQEKKVWVPVDPTWGNTTGGINYFDQFDFNHFVFSYNGLSSTLPYAAGSYRKERQIENNIEVKFGKDPQPEEARLQFDLKRDNDLSSVLQPKYIVKVTNVTGVAWYNLPIELQSSSEDVSVSSSAQTLDYILPFQTREITLQATSTPRWKTRPFRLTLSINGISSTYDLYTGLNFQGALNPNVIAVGLVGSLALIAALTWGVLVSRRPRYRSLRR